jgi:hypothetical protein
MKDNRYPHERPHSLLGPEGHGVHSPQADVGVAAMSRQ